MTNAFEGNSFVSASYSNNLTTFVGNIFPGLYGEDEAISRVVEIYTALNLTTLKTAQLIMSEGK